MGLKNCIYTSWIGKWSSFWISVLFLMPPAGVSCSNAHNHSYLGYVVSASPQESQPSHQWVHATISEFTGLNGHLASLLCLSFPLGLYLPAWSQLEPLSLSLNHQVHFLSILFSFSLTHSLSCYHQSNVLFRPTQTLWTSVYTLTMSSSWTLWTS